MGMVFNIGRAEVVWLGAKSQEGPDTINMCNCNKKPRDSLKKPWNNIYIKPWLVKSLQKYNKH